MEILFNLLWAALSIALSGLWLLGRTRCTKSSPDTSVHLQITALAVLIVILFPVVSLTDDLLAYTAPAEAEHLVRRDLHDLAAGPTGTTAVILAALFAFPHAGSAILYRTPPSMKLGTPHEKSLDILGIRPPPSA